MDLFRKTMKPVERVLRDANVKKEEVDEVRQGALLFLT
jgi:heat shock protein 5